MVPGGGLSADGEERWVTSRRNYFLPIAVLRKVFRGKLLLWLTDAYRRGDLTLAGKLDGLREPEAFARYLKPLWKQKWVVYAKAPFGGPEQVLKYLARCTHRVAIANSRLLDVNDDGVRFRRRDYRDGQHKVMQVDGAEFLRRFTLHIQPKGLQRIRHYGILANRNKQAPLAHCRALIGVAQELFGANQANDATEVDDRDGNGAVVTEIGHNPLHHEVALCSACAGVLLRCRLDPWVSPRPPRTDAS